MARVEAILEVQTATEVTAEMKSSHKESVVKYLREPKRFGHDVRGPTV